MFQWVYPVPRNVLLLRVPRLSSEKNGSALINFLFIFLLPEANRIINTKVNTFFSTKQVWSEDTTSFKNFPFRTAHFLSLSLIKVLIKAKLKCASFANVFCLLSFLQRNWILCPFTLYSSDDINRGIHVKNKL